MALALTLRIRINNRDGLVLGPGRADLLGYIQTTGSIAAAGREMKMSYKRAWALVEAMNATFTSPLVTASKGGAGGGGAKLTSLGTKVLHAYRDVEQRAQNSASEALTSLASLVAVPPVLKTL